MSCVWKEIGARVCERVLSPAQNLESLLRAIHVLFPKRLLSELACHPLPGGEMPCFMRGGALTPSSTWVLILSSARF